MFFSRFHSLCDENSVSPNALAAELGISSGTVTNWKKGRKPKIDHLILISHRFDVSIDYLVGESDIRNAESELKAILRMGAEWPVTDSELAFLKLIRSHGIPPEKLDALLRLIH